MFTVTFTMVFGTTASPQVEVKESLKLGIE